MTNKTKNTNGNKKPNWRLVQDKAFYKTTSGGKQIRDTKIIEIAVGWNEVGQESGNPYISWSDSVTPVLPDVDGRIVLRSFEINYDENK